MKFWNIKVKLFIEIFRNVRMRISKGIILLVFILVGVL